jgi:hypothetical protein
VADGTADFNFFVSATHPYLNAMWIFQDLRRGLEYVWSAMGVEPGSAVARWMKDQNSLGICSGGSCYWPDNPITGIFIAHKDIVSSDVVVHELGHQYMDNAREWWGIDCLTHSLFASISSRCAWSEGWGDFFALAANGDPCFDFGIGPCGAGANPFENLETQNSRDGRPTGDTVEGRVAGALYDIYDLTSDGLDHVGYGLDEIWTLMSTGAVENTFADFWSNWKSSAYPQHWTVQAIYQNTIDYDEPPHIQLPDVTVFKDMVINNVLDLWDYSSDSESEDADLAWSIVGMSNGSCGVAVQGHYIATAPMAGFLGNCDITVRVNDGLKTSDDSFTVHIVEVHARSFLPLSSKSTAIQLQSPLVLPSPFVSPLPVPGQPNPFISPVNLPEN